MFRSRLLASVVSVAVVASPARPLFAQTTTRVSVGPGGVEGDGDSCFAAVSSNGRFVAFSSESTNLVPNGVQTVTHQRGFGRAITLTLQSLVVDAASSSADGVSVTNVVVVTVP